MIFNIRPPQGQPINGAVYAGIDSQPTPSSFPSSSLNTNLPVVPGILTEDLCNNGKVVRPLQSPPNSKMKAVPQRPGPSGSRVIKKRTSIPRLGDGLRNVLQGVLTTANHGSGTNLELAGRHASVSDHDTDNSLTLISSQQSPSTVTVTPSRSDRSSLSSETEASEVETPLHPTSLDKGSNNVTSCTIQAALSDTDDRTGVWANDETNTYQSPPNSSRRTSSDSVSVPSSEGVHLSSPATSPSTPRDGQNGVPAEFFKKQASRKTLSPQAPKFRPSIQSTTQHHDKPMLALHLSSAVTVGSPEQIRMRNSAATETISNGFSYSQPIYPTAEKAQDCTRTLSSMPAYPAPQAVAHVSGSVESPDIEDAIDRICVSCCAGEIDLSQAVKAYHNLVRHKRLEAEKLQQSIPQFPINQAHQSHGIQIPNNSPVYQGPIVFKPINSGLPSQLNPPKVVDMRVSLELKLANYAPRDVAGRATEVHIFVDMSNIFIGFCDSYKISRHIPVQQWIKAPRFFFKVFACIMERARNVKKRVLAGSIGTPANRHAQWPQHFLEAEQLQYEMNIFDRVQKEKTPNKSNRRGKTSPRGPTSSCPNEVASTSADESTEDGMAPAYATRNAEQGVDENLHLNMMNSMMDYISNPGTMVLATGDAAEAEFSDGFMQYAIRALTMGWKLELVTWKKTISSAWTSPDFLKKYGNNFRIIYLDDFIEELQSDIRGL
ncbi:hypothetical protein F5B20DRAFT_106052 [Whalleya microplaca]|nr:hypothetical protein F5B20DRAFT_106052 [Whalleya microplaca]